MINTFYLRFFTALLLIFSFTIATQAQSLASQSQVERIKTDIKVEKVQISKDRGTPSLITFDRFQQDSYKEEDVKAIIEQHFGLEKSKEKINLKNSINYHDQIKTTRYQQYYNDVKVEHGNIVSLTKEGQLAAINAEYYNVKSSNLNLSATLTEEEALLSALNFVGAETYAWTAILDYMNGVNAPDLAAVLYEEYQNHYPQAELVLVDDYNTTEVDLDLAYKFNIYATQPLSRNWIYINAHTGKVMLKNAIIKHLSGETRYSGTQNFGSEVGASGSFELLNENLGGGIETLSLANFNAGVPLSIGAAYSLAESFEDNNGVWTQAEHRPDDFSLPYPTHNENNNHDIGLDAHWGAEVVYNYWLQIHNRLSYDDEDARITSFVHYGDAYDNAFWNGSFMTYGDGSYQEGTNPNGSFAPLTSLDVCGHEIGHAICTFTSDLVYARESGAMNEGFSDIWAACVENYADDGTFNFDPWGIGEQIDERDGGIEPGQPNSRALRWMDDPKAASDPDTYGGDHWQEPECGEPTLANDQCGVHGNSGILNKWFYLLTVGSQQAISPGSGKNADDGVNDMNDAYAVEGLGFAAAERMAFLTETFLTPNAKFEEARAAGIEAAGILYGPCTNEQTQMKNAWDAINVTGPDLDCTPTVDFLFESTTVNENASPRGCNASEDMKVQVFAITSGTENITISAAGSGANPATPGEDFDVVTTNLSFSTGDLPKGIEVIIYNDGEVEETEEFTISFNDKTHVVTILNDDIDPAIGAQDDSRAAEDFSASAIPTEWSIQNAGEQGATWQFDGTKAYIGINNSGLAIYNINTPSNTMLVTKPIDTRGYSNIRVSFDYTVGGENDTATGDNEDGTYFDYGALLVSRDGENFVEIEKYAGTCIGASCAERTGSVDARVLDGYGNSILYIGFLWYNDALAGAADLSSFSVDNFSMIGDGTPIATSTTANGSNEVNDGTYAYFFSDTEELIARVEATGTDGEDLGCLSTSITQEGTGTSAYLTGIRTDKVFEISDADGGTEPYIITLYYTNAELGGFAPESYSILKVSGSDINGPNPETATTTYTALPNGNHAFSAPYTTGFSSFTLYSGDPILAVDLVTLKATALNDAIRLDWITATETDNKGFMIERRAEDEASFQKIGWIDGAGHTNTERTYAHIDRDVKDNTTYYYRLQQLDFSGDFNYSETVSSKLSKTTTDIEVYPNPTADVINVYLPENETNSKTIVSLLNARGQIISAENISENGAPMQIDVSSYPSGIYFLRINRGTQQTIKRVVVKN